MIDKRFNRTDTSPTAIWIRLTNWRKRELWEANSEFGNSVRLETHSIVSCSELWNRRSEVSGHSFACSRLCSLVHESRIERTTTRLQHRFRHPPGAKVDRAASSSKILTPTLRMPRNLSGQREAVQDSRLRVFHTSRISIPTSLCRRLGLDKDRWQISGVWLDALKGIGSTFFVVTCRSALNSGPGHHQYVIICQTDKPT